MPEAGLYPPIKRFLEAQGYEVKGEVGACDVVAVREGEDPIIVELKDRLTLALVLQAVDRLTMSEMVYLAFRAGRNHSATWRTKRKQVLSLLRRLGIGLLTVSSRGQVRAVLDPAGYRPRTNRKRKRRLLKEFAERVGDPETGGSATSKRLTAYRQDAIRCASVLADGEVLKLSLLKERTGVERAGNILRDNHYGWFERVRVGHYTLSPRGMREITDWSGTLTELEERASDPSRTPTV